jgi:tripartite-type tricarboxylate transporter receptor subunit TctC
MKRSILRFLLSAVLLPGLAAPALADGWPSRPITLIVPLAAGGSTDTTARLVAAKLKDVLGQPVVVENRPGAGTNIGTDFVAKAPPDGYTLLFTTSTLATNASLYKSLPYDINRDLVPVSQATFIPNVLVVPKDFPAKDLGEFIRYIKDDKGRVNYGSAGNGTSLHLAGALFNSMAGGHMTHIPYKGGSEVSRDLLANQIQAGFSPMVEVLSFIESGKLRALGITTRERSPRLPDVPAIDQLLPGYEVVLWNGVFAPARTPGEVVDKLSGAIRAVLHDPDVTKTLAEQGSVPAGSTPSDFKAFVASEQKKWAGLVKLSGAHVD